MSEVGQKIAKRYARALFDLTPAERYDEISAYLRGVTQIVETSDELKVFLNNPALKEQELLALFESVVSHFISAPSEEANRMLKMIVRGRRLAILPALLRSFDDLVREYRRSLSVEVVTPKELPAEEKRSMEEHLAQKLGGNVAVRYKIDGSLVGGIIVRHGDRQIDRSIAGMVERLQNFLVV